jgi:amphi-Trp domain-containing protein
MEDSMAKKQQLFRQKERKSRAEVSEFVQVLGQKIGEGQVVLKGAAGDQTLDLPQKMNLKVKASKKAKKHKGAKHKLTVQITWVEGDYEDGGLELG